MVERLDGKRKEWMLAKMRSIGLNEGDKLVGLGERTIVSFMSEKTFFTSLSELVNKHGAGPGRSGRCSTQRRGTSWGPRASTLNHCVVSD